MRRIGALMLMMLLVPLGTVSAAEVSKDTSARVNLISEKASKMSSSKVGEYARQDVGAAQTSISEAKLAMAAGNEKLAQQKIELAEMQLTIAEARTAEKEALEQATLKRAELKKLEAQLDSFFKEGGK